MSDINSTARSRKSNSRRTHDRHLLRCRTFGRWFAFSHDYLDIMSHMAALVVQSITNMYGAEPRSKLSKRMRRRGYVLCMARFLESRLRIKKNAQIRILKELQALGFIKVKRAGDRGRRFVKIRQTAIELALDAVEDQKRRLKQKTRDIPKEKPDVTISGHLDVTKSGHLDVTKSGRHIEKHKVRNKNPLRGSPPSRNGRSLGNGRSERNGLLAGPEDKANPKHVEWSKKLRAALRRSTKRIAVNGYSVKGGAGEFAKLVKSLDGDEVYVEKQLDRYCGMVDKVVKPTIASASQFCKQFNWLKDTMDAMENKELGTKEVKQVTEVVTEDLGNGRTRCRPVTRNVEVRVKWIKNSEGGWDRKETPA